jgi:Protein of unknown function (DUF3891)
VLLRRDERGQLAIGQPSHAWISGQIARAWGNERFGPLVPYEEVCLAAEQHDIGMAEWDLRPTRNPETGLPHRFTEMPLATHLELWRAAPRRLLRQSRYAALLVSMHGARLYERRDLTRLPPSEAQRVTAFLNEQRRLQQDLSASLQADPATRAVASPETIARNSRLIWTWDSLSLGICLDWAPTTLEQVPAAEGTLDVSLSSSSGARELILDPWPLRVDTLTVRCEGQRLAGGVETQDALDRALAEAPWETLEFTLVPDRSPRV